jgi:DeoR/GlpR family transcriptional regulator of sugar metabolism
VFQTFLCYFHKFSILILFVFLSKHLKEKQEIARKATVLFEGKNTIVADSSTTVVEALKLLPNSTDITVVTNSTEIFREFQQSAINFISTGGEYNKKSCSLQGQLAKTNIAKYNVSLALISCKGVSIEKGVQDTNESEAEVKKAMLAQADEVALLVDSSKFDQSAFVSLIGLDKVNYIITDSRPSDEWVAYCESHEIQLIY